MKRRKETTLYYTTFFPSRQRIRKSLCAAICAAGRFGKDFSKKSENGVPSQLRNPGIYVVSRPCGHAKANIP